MTIIRSDINPRGEAFATNTAAMQALVTDLRAQVAKVELGGGESSRKRTFPVTNSSHGTVSPA